MTAFNVHTVVVGFPKKLLRFTGSYVKSFTENRL